MILFVAFTAPSAICKPRASGDDPGYVRYLPAEVDVNPARAGMIHRPVPGMRGIKRKPRASGDDPESPRLAA